MSRVQGIGLPGATTTILRRQRLLEAAYPIAVGQRNEPDSSSDIVVHDRSTATTNVAIHSR